MYIGDYLRRRALYSPEKLAVADHGKVPPLRLTWREMNALADRLAHWLAEEAGVGKGDRVAILARDGVEHLLALYACGKLGAIHTPLSWRLHPRELAALVAKTTPRVLVFDDESRAAAAEVRRAVEGLPGTLARLLHLDGEGLPGSVPWAEALSSPPPSPVTCPTLEAEDPACILFTGGTTGLPKAVLISHRMIAWNVLNTIIHDLRHDDVVLNVFPLFHAGGLFCYWSSQVVLGNTTIQVRRFDPEQVLDLIERERVTVFAGVPSMYEMLTQAPNWDRADLTSLRFCTSGGAPLPVPLIEKYVREKGVRFKQGFGMTEFGPGVFALAAEDAVRKAGSIGRPNFFVDARVVDEANRPVGPGVVGELVLKGPSLCSGYFGDPAAPLVDEEGYFHTGDLVTYDEEGYFFVVGRKKDMFISGGENVYPREIEEVLYRHPAVASCAVAGIPDPKWGEVGAAFVVLKQEATEQELLAYLQAHLARFKIPKRVVFLDALPLSGMGKPLKDELRKALLEGRFG
ncbi:MAG: long-chain fatty acid--CoA ligase [Candidatus Acetothermia bacterium]|nr:long-chain fatty acid--CoA ligase [Candidatus Acetothermia bacterium]